MSLFGVCCESEETLGTSVAKLKLELMGKLFKV